MTHLNSLFTFTFCGLGLLGCSKEEGPGYEGEICVRLSHHGNIPSDATVYRVYGDSFPGYGLDMAARFDESLPMGPTGQVCFKPLNAGIHWLAAEGWDDFIGDSLRGSKRVELTTRAELFDGVLEVSEQH